MSLLVLGFLGEKLSSFSLVLIHKNSLCFPVMWMAKNWQFSLREVSRHISIGVSKLYAPIFSLFCFSSSFRLSPLLLVLLCAHRKPAAGLKTERLALGKLWFHLESLTFTWIELSHWLDGYAPTRWEHHYLVNYRLCKRRWRWWREQVSSIPLVSSTDSLVVVLYCLLRSIFSLGLL